MGSIEPELAATAGRLRGDEAGPFVRYLNARTGRQFMFLGMAELGETNAAAYVQWPDGRQSVLTRTRYPIEHLERTAEILDLVRACGIPAPRYELIVQVQHWVAAIQERLPGVPLSGKHIDLPMMEAILALNESFAGLLIHRTDVPTIDVTPSFGKYAVLNGYDGRTRDLLARIRKIHQIHETNGKSIVGHDLVHGDLTRRTFCSTTPALSPASWTGMTTRSTAETAATALSR